MKKPGTHMFPPMAMKKGSEYDSLYFRGRREESVGS